MKQLLTIGRTDKVDLPEMGIENVNAKIDTGAYTSAIHCKKIKTSDGVLSFYIDLEQDDQNFSKKYQTRNFSRKKIRSSNGESQTRYVIKTKITLFGKNYVTEFSLSDRSKMKNPILIGRKLLNKKFLVDVSKKNLSFEQKSNPK